MGADFALPLGLGKALAYRDSRAFHGMSTRGMGGTNVPPGALSAIQFFFLPQLKPFFGPAFGLGIRTSGSCRG